MARLSSFFAAVLLASVCHAHQAVWHESMWCANGTTPGVDDLVTGTAANPLHKLPFSEWWMHGRFDCNKFPPAPGKFLEFPAGGDTTVEIAENRIFTTLSYGGKKATEWGDGQHHPEGYSITNLGGAKMSSSGCLGTPNLHTTNESMAAGTAFAISYTSNLDEVTPENLVVFTVAPNTPYKRLATYSVPADMPPCPEGGCICAWGWVPYGCGQGNMFLMPYRCKITNTASSAKNLASPKPPVWCGDDKSQCVKGAKQMVYWQQLEGNNIEVEGYDLAGHRKSLLTTKSLDFHLALRMTSSSPARPRREWSVL